MFFHRRHWMLFAWFIFTFPCCYAFSQEAEIDIQSLLDEAWELLLKSDTDAEQMQQVKIDAFNRLGMRYLSIKNRERAIACFQQVQTLTGGKAKFVPTIEEFADNVLNRDNAKNRNEPQNDNAKLSQKEVEKLRIPSEIESQWKYAESSKDPHQKIWTLKLLVAKIVPLGFLDEAIKTVEKFPKEANSYSQARLESLCLIRNAYEKRGDKEKAASLDRECRKILASLPRKSSSDKDGYLQALIRIGDTEEALKLLESREKNSFEYNDFLEKIVLETARTRRYARAVELAGKTRGFERTPDEFKDVPTQIETKKFLIKVVSQQLDNGDLADAENTLSQIDATAAAFFADKVRAYCAIAKKYDALGRHEEAKNAVREALQLIAEAENVDDRVWVGLPYVLYIADAMCAVNQREEAVSLLRKSQQMLFEEYDSLSHRNPGEENPFKSGPHRITWILETLAVAQSRAGDSEGCLLTLQKELEMLKDNAPGADAEPALISAFQAWNSEVVKSLAREGFFREAISALNAIDNEFFKANAMIGIVESVAAHKNGVKLPHRVYDEMINAPISR